MKLQPVSNPSLKSFCGREYFKEVGLNNYYCIEDNQLFFCSKDGEPCHAIDEQFWVVA